MTAPARDAPGFRCLALETTSETCSVAACDGDRVVARSFDEAMERSREIYRWIDGVLRELNLRLSDLDCIAVGIGPGGFTGLRVGCAAAQALAFGAQRPICPVSSLAALAAGAMRVTGAGRVAPCLDARMGEVYAALYQGRPAAMTPVREDCLAAPAVLDLPGDEPFVAAGPGWRAYPELATRFAARIESVASELRPFAGDLLPLAAAGFAAGAVVGPEQLRPNYLRDRVVRTVPAAGRSG